MVYEWAASGNDAGFQPAGGGNKHRYGVLGARYIEQTGNVSALGFNPARSATDYSSSSHPEKAVAGCKTRLLDAFAKCVVTLCDKHPCGIRCRFEELFHLGRSAHSAIG
jgi:hypothetical protein